MKHHHFVLITASVFALSALACGLSSRPDETSSGRDETSSGAPVAAAGRIRGIVKLRGAAPAPRSEATGQNQDVCGPSVPVTRLSVGANGGVQHAFVYLDASLTASASQPRATIEVKQERCVYAPHSLIVPAGTSIEIVNDDPILHNVHAKEETPDGLRTVFNIAQPVRGQRTKLDAPFKKPGVVTMTCEAGHPWMTAHVLVADHPYVATTAADGTFTIENVPAGAYPLTMWHEGVALTRVLTSLQRYEYEAPYQATEQVVVPPGGEVEVTFALQLR